MDHDAGAHELHVSQEDQNRSWWHRKLMKDDEAKEQEWWFASTAIPLLAATAAPLANVFSIAALVSSWRTRLYTANGAPLEPFFGRDIPDPHWVYGTNLTSLICGYVGNIFLLLNFTNRVPYIFALPVTVFLWYISFAILTGIQVSMSLHAAPGDREDYTQAFWYGIIASVLYFAWASILLVNMLGYFLGHYPKHFNLTEAQRTLILQTFLFFIWLAGGAGVFQELQRQYGSEDEQWNYSDALYFCDVTILTIGYGDLVSDNNVGRGFVLPYSVGGIIMLGLMVSSIATFAREISDANIVQKRAEKQRLHTVERTVNPDAECIRVQDRRDDAVGTRSENTASRLTAPMKRSDTTLAKVVKRTGTGLIHVPRPNRRKRPSLIVLREEKDRFEAMRKIQADSASFKKWSALMGSLTVLICLWFVGAIIFWQLEKDYSHWSALDGIYFCYISLLTIGYGDFTPATNAGRPFFVIWSLLAVPSITILITDLADTVVSSFRDWTNAIGDFTLLAKDGVWHDLLNRNIWVIRKFRNHHERKEDEKRVGEGLKAGLSEDDEFVHKVKTIEELAEDRQNPLSDHQLAGRLAATIKTVSRHVTEDKPRKYEYEDWVDFTRLIRFTRGKEAAKEEDEEEGLLEWDWIGQEGPIMSQNEPSWLLDRLVGSMNRYVRKQARDAEARELLPTRLLALKQGPDTAESKSNQSGSLFVDANVANGKDD